MTALKTSICCIALALLGGLARAEEHSTVDFRIEPRSMKSALTQFGEQTGLQIMFSKEAVDDLHSQGVVGTYPPEDALRQLIANSALRYEFVNNRTVRIWSTTSRPIADANSNSNPASAELRLTQIEDPQAAATEPRDAGDREETGEQRISRGIPEILVQGSKILNIDIRRTRDDTQPYVVFERETLERSGATNLEDFLKQRLTMNTQSSSFAQSSTTFGTASQINLRGLGTNNTLILIDGHRTIGPIQTGGSPSQSDLNGIPLSAVERVEVLPTTGSGIYGGSATGGVVNIILRRDYSGAEAKLSYENTFDSDAAIRRVDFSAGLNLHGGKTNLLFGANLTEQNPLLARERDFFQRGRDTIQRNNPGFFPNAASPPLGATPNIRSLNGSPLFGPGTSNITFVPAGYAGGAGLAPFLANAGKYNFALADTRQGAGGARRGLMSDPSTDSLMLTVRREFTTSLQGFIDMSRSSNTSDFSVSSLIGTYTVDATAQNNPFGQAVRVTAPISSGDSIQHIENDSQRIVGGVIARLPRGWQAAADYTWQQAAWRLKGAPFSLGAEVAAIGNGSLNILRDTSLYPVDIAFAMVPLSSSRRKSTLKDVTLRLSGPFGSLPAGDPVISGSLEYREDFFSDGFQYFVPDSYLPSRFQTVSSAYLETKIPLFSSRNAKRALHSLELQLAGRWDEYKVTGGIPFFAVGSNTPIDQIKNRTTSIDPTVGLRYQPIQDIVLRASYGTGFLPPSVGQLYPQPAIASTTTAVDPRRGNTVIGAIQVVNGGNPNLKPELSESCSVGVVFTPRQLPGFRLSVDWTRIDKSDNISNLQPQPIVDNESSLPGRIVRGPVPANDPYGVGRITFIDLTSVNLSDAQAEAYDVAADYSWETDTAGRFDFYALATWQTHYKTRITPLAPLIENVGITATNPLKFKANAGLNWKHRSVTVGWAARYFDSYQVALSPTTTGAPTVLNQGGVWVADQIYHDVFATYAFDASAGGSRMSWLLADSELSLGVKNVFNKEPPFDAGSDFYYSRFADPRLASYQIAFKKIF